MRALAVGCGGNYQGGVKVIWAHSQVLSFQVGQPILNKAYISQSHCSRKEESYGLWMTVSHTFQVHQQILNHPNAAIL